jgi:signal recognition particle subunit SRP54
MFTLLSNKLTTAIKTISGRGRLTEDNIQETLGEIRLALLEADVALLVVEKVLEDISAKAIGQEIIRSLRPSETLIKIVNDELINIMGREREDLNFRVEPPGIILMAGLQGSGKTTTVAKLARLIKEDLKKSVIVVSADIYRPAAIKQLETLAQQIDVRYFPSDISQKPVDIVKAAVVYAKKSFIDVIIIDTAGRLHIDQAMMAEIIAIHQAVNPIETLFVVDSMTGQDAVNTAQAFNTILPLTGVILTKTDGDARGGAALSVRVITGKPIKFIGTGEKINDLEPFYPDRIVSRILGMGDILTLIEETEKKIDKEKVHKLAKKIVKGHGFDLEDFKDQLQQLTNMGGIDGLLSKLPNMGIPNIEKLLDDKKFKQMEVIIDSMTIRERRFPDLIRNLQKQRIAKGSGTEVQDVNRLLKQFSQMQKMMKHFKGGKMMGLLKKFL